MKNWLRRLLPEHLTSRVDSIVNLMDTTHNTAGFRRREIDWERLIEAGTISKEDLNLFVIKNSVNDTFDYLMKNMQK